MKTYHLNPFCTITSTPQGIILNGLPDLRVVFEQQHRVIVDFLVERKTVCETDLLKLLAQTRIDELITKKVLIPGEFKAYKGRYSRQEGYFLMTTDKPIEVSRRLGTAHVLILGVGAIGSHVLWNLAAMGIGKITLVDFDHVEESNLNRQLMYNPSDVGKSKVGVIAERIQSFNPSIEIIPLDKRIESELDVQLLLDRVNLVVKAIDTPEESNSWVNSACVRSRVPFILGGFLDCVGVVGPNYVPWRSSCYACVGDAGNVTRLHGTGATFAPLTTTVASKLSMLAYKILTNEDENFSDRVFSYDTRIGRWLVEDVVRNETCRVCGLPPTAREREEPVERNRLMYRSALVVTMTMAVTLREVFDQTFVGALMLLVMLMTLPLVYFIENQDTAATRRQFFVIACIYIVFSIIALAIDQLKMGAFPKLSSLDAVFVATRSLCVLVAQGALAITLLFFFMCALLKIVPAIIEFSLREIAEI